MLESSIRDTVLKICGPDHRPIGTGFLVTATGTALTCYHVFKKSTTDGRTVEVDLGGRVLRATLDERASDQASDIAVLTIQPNVRLAHAVLALPQADSDVRAYGFREKWNDGFQLTGKLRPGQRLASVGELWNLTDTSMSSGMSVARMSGSPVFDAKRDVVVGMIYGEEHAGASIVYVHPMTKLKPTLRERLGVLQSPVGPAQAPHSTLDPFAYDGLFKLGNVELAFSLLFGSVLKGQNEYRPGDVICETRDEEFELAPEFRANQIDGIYGDDPKCRLVEVRHLITGRNDPNMLQLTFSRTTYADYLRSGEFLDAPLPSAPTSTFRAKYASTLDTTRLGESRLTNICGVGVFVVTRDNRLIVARHSANVRVRPNVWGFAASGTMDWALEVHPFDDASRESREEIGHELNMEATSLIAAGIDTKHMYYQFCFVERSSLAAVEIINRASFARDYGVEVAELRALPFELRTLVDALRSREWEPAAAATILMLASKEFGLDAVENYLVPDIVKAQQRAGLVTEWEHRASREGVMAVMSARFPAHRCAHESSQFVAAALQFIGPDLDDRTLLEVGGGIGRFTEHFVSRARQLTCVDISPTMLERNRGRLGKLSEAVEYLQLFIQDFRPSRRYDVAVCSQVLIHSVDDGMFQDAVDSIARCADTVFVFDHVDSTQAVSSFTRVRTEAELVAAFRGYVVARRQQYWLFNDKLVFLKLVRLGAQ